jgi:hypothetical protein
LLETVGDEGVARVLALHHTGEVKALGQVHRHVFEGVDGQISPALLERDLQFLHEQALAAYFAQAAVEDLVAPGGHAQQAHLVTARLQKVAYMFGLPKGQPAFARGDD